MKKTLRYVFVILSLLLVLSQTYVYSDKLVKNNNNNLWGDNPPTADVREQTVYKTSLTNDTISDEEYKQKVVEFYATYKTGVIPKKNASYTIKITIYTNVVYISMFIMPTDYLIITHKRTITN